MTFRLERLEYRQQGRLADRGRSRPAAIAQSPLRHVGANATAYVKAFTFECRFCSLHTVADLLVALWRNVVRQIGSRTNSSPLRAITTHILFPS
jgi:hypothetical protein